MKVIQQLIAHFEGKDQLSRNQLQEFTAKGYWGNYTPADLRALENKIGQGFFFQVTGKAHGPLWGTDVYTSDSSLEAACVHAGALKSGEAGTVRVTMVQPLAVFNGSTRNGVRSDMWTTGWAGAFTVEALKKE